MAEVPAIGQILKSTSVFHKETAQLFSKNECGISDFQQQTFTDSRYSTSSATPDIVSLTVAITVDVISRGFNLDFANY